MWHRALTLRVPRRGIGAAGDISGCFFEVFSSRSLLARQGVVGHFFLFSHLGGTHLDRICIGLCGICFAEVKVKADRGTSMLETLGLESYGGLFNTTA